MELVLIKAGPSFLRQVQRVFRVWHPVYCHILLCHIGSEVGGESNQEIVLFRFVRVCVRAVWLPSGIRYAKTVPPFSLFSFHPAEFSLFPFSHPKTPV